MSHPNYTESRKEDLEMNGQLISSKTIYEIKKSKSVINIFEILLKLLGLILIVIAVLEYCHKINQDKELAQRQIDQDKELSIRQIKSDSALKQQSLQSQANFRQEQAFKNEQTNKIIANSFQQLYKQKELETIRDKQKEIREYYTETLPSASIQMERIINKPINSDGYEKAIESLYFELMPRIFYIKDTNLNVLLNDFKNYTFANEGFQRVEIILDSIEKVRNRISKIFPEIYKILKSDIHTNISEQIEMYLPEVKALDNLKDKANVELSNIESYLGKIDDSSAYMSNSLYNQVVRLQNEGVRGVDDYITHVKSFQSSLKNIGIDDPGGLNAERRLKLYWDNARSFTTGRFLFNKYSYEFTESYKNFREAFKDVKDRFDSIVQKKIKLYE